MYFLASQNMAWLFLRFHECTPSVIAYYTQPGLVYYTLPGVRPYITCIAKQVDEGFAGTQLYRQKVCFFLPLSLLTLDRHNQCKFVLKVDDKNIFIMVFFLPTCFNYFYSIFKLNLFIYLEVEMIN
jgi:hypothetical protein